MMLDREKFASDQKHTQYLSAWDSLQKAMDAEDAGNEAQARMHLAAACHRELQSLGFESTLAGMNTELKAWFKLPEQGIKALAA